MQFTTAKRGCANVLSNTSSGALQVCSWLSNTHPGLQDRILLNYTRIENAHRVRKKTFIFLLCIEVQQTFSFPFSLLKHYQIPECFYVNNCYFELVQLFYHATEIGNVVNAVSACGEQPIVVWDIMNYCGTQISKTRSGRKVCKKWWDGSWMQTITQKI